MRKKTTMFRPELLAAAALPPWIIMCYLYVQNAAYINYWHVLLVAAVFSALSFGFYLALARLGKSPERAALVTVALWIAAFAIKPLYTALDERAAFLSRRLCQVIVVSIFLGLLGAVFVLGKRVRRREVFVLLTVFETVLFALNFIPGTFSFFTNKDARLALTLSDDDWTVAGTPSPNIYWLFMDGMLGFKGMEQLFGDRQDGFAAALAERGFLVNRTAEFEVFHATIRAIPALMCPGYYDTTFLPLLDSVDLSNYKLKYNAIVPINPINARLNNEFVAAFNAKGYTTNIIAGWGGYFYPTSTCFFMEGKIVKSDNKDVAGIVHSYTQDLQLAQLFTETCAPYMIIAKFVLDSISSKYQKMIDAEEIDASASIGEKEGVYGSANAGSAWYVDALEAVFTESEPRFTILHDGVAHYPFLLNEDGSKVMRSKVEEENPANYPPQHRYAAKVVLGYIDLILAHDPDAVIVVEADHGLHHEASRKALLAAGGTDEDVRVMQNSVMSAVRIPDKWGGLDAPLDPLNISRVLINRFVGDNYTLLEHHP